MDINLDTIRNNVYARRRVKNDFNQEVIKFEVDGDRFETIGDCIEFLISTEEQVCTSENYKFNDFEITGVELVNKIKEIQEKCNG